MKTRIQLPLVASILLLGFQQAASGQGTAFTYQGRLNDGAAPATGTYDLQFTVYDSSGGPAIVAGPTTLPAASVSNGLFTVTLDFGSGVFTGPARWLEVAVRTNGGGAFTALSPRQQLTPSPYAIHAGNVNASGINGTIPAANLSGTYSNAVTFNHGANSFSGTFFGQFLGVSFIGGSFSGAFIGDGSGLINLNASQLSSGTVPDARLPLTAARTSQVWLLNGNPGTTAGTHFLGTTDGAPLELKVANDRVFRFEPAAEVPNLIGGSRSNFVSAGIRGATIAGGGLPLYPNFISADFGAIGGGTFNGVTGPWGTVAGGRDNRAYSESATVGGGFRNGIETNSWFSTIAGGEYNLIASNSFDAFIGGGAFNIISNNAGQSTIAGGYENQIHSNSFSAVISGGQLNRITNDSYYSVIAGGFLNRIHSNSFATTIGGGEFNQASGGDSTVAGGGGNRALASAATISGGSGNLVESSWSVIGGGRDNVISSNSIYTTIGGGFSNEVDRSGFGSTIAGGQNNEIGFNSFYCGIGGGIDNLIQRASFYSTIAGGQRNLIGTNSFHTIISGGWSNYANGSFLAIGGGSHNTNTGQWGMIPGGYSNLVSGSYSFAAGQQARATHNGTFVWADSTAGVFPSVVSNEFAVRASGGVRFVTSGAGLTVDGLPVVSGGAVNATTLGGLASSNFWQLGGNTVAPGQFLGSVNNQDVDLRVNNTRALRLDYTTAGEGPNITAGSSANNIPGGVLGGVIGGGGSTAEPNTISSTTAHYSTIAGGRGNAVTMERSTIGGGSGNQGFETNGTVAGGSGNSVQGTLGSSTIGGGLNNINASHQAGTIAGGMQNHIFAGNTAIAFIGGGYQNFIETNGFAGTIVGGYFNFLTASYAAIGGGYFNTNFGTYAAVPGGYKNKAAGDYSFAAGRQAKADHEGAFVWGDSTDADFVSTSSNQFLIRAGGGVGINTANPGSNALSVAGTTQFGSGTGTAEAPEKGLILRRAISTVATLGLVVARTDKLTLERDGSSGGWRIVNAASPGFTTIAATGLSNTGTTVNFVTSLVTGAAAGTNVVFSNAQNIVSFRCTFGDNFTPSQLTEVSLARYPGDSFWTGTITSTYNQ